MLNRLLRMFKIKRPNYSVHGYGTAYRSSESYMKDPKVIHFLKQNTTKGNINA